MVNISRLLSRSSHRECVGMAARARRRSLLHRARAPCDLALPHTGEQPVAAAGDGTTLEKRSHSVCVSD